MQQSYRQGTNKEEEQFKDQKKTCMEWKET